MFGLTTTKVRATSDPRVRELTARVDEDGGAVLGIQRSVRRHRRAARRAADRPRRADTVPARSSEPHVKRLMTVIEKIGRFLDPLVIVRHDERYWTPNGNHRLQAMRKLGAKTITGLLVPSPTSRTRFWRSTPRRRTT